MSEMYVATLNGREAALKRQQPILNSVTLDANFTRDTSDGTKDPFELALDDLGINFDFLGQFGAAFQLLIDNIIFGITGIWDILKVNLEGFGSELQTGYETLKANWDALLNAIDLPDLGSWTEFKEAWDMWMDKLGLPDLGNWEKFKEEWDAFWTKLGLADLETAWRGFKERWDEFWGKLGFGDLSDVDLSSLWGEFKASWDEWVGKLGLPSITSWTDFKTEWNGFFGRLGLADFETAWRGFKEKWDEFFGKLGFGDLTDIDLGSMWGEFKAAWDEWVGKLGLPSITGWNDFKKEWDALFGRLGMPDIGSWDKFKASWDDFMRKLSISDWADAGNWDDFKSGFSDWAEKLGIPDLGEYNGWKSLWDSWANQLQAPLLGGWNNFKLQWDNWVDSLNISGQAADIGKKLEAIVNEYFAKAERTFKDLFLLKNPFFPAIGEQYLIKFEKGGLLQGPSHDQGGVKAVVGNRRMVELEGGEYIVNKKAVSNLGVDFLSLINSAGKPGKKQEISKYGFTRFDWGGPVSVDDYKNKGGGSADLLKNSIGSAPNVQRFFQDLTGQIGSLGGALDTNIKLASPTYEAKTNTDRAKIAGEGTQIPDLVEPSTGLPSMKFFDVSVQTKGWLKSMIGDHKIAVDAGFPSGFNAEMYQAGGAIALNPEDIGGYKEGTSVLPSSRLLARDSSGRTLNDDVLLQKTLKPTYSEELLDKDWEFIK
ncbi:MAG: hypothetical protein VW235_12880, partial [Rhodospirillaceae bacterium]